MIRRFLGVAVLLILLAALVWVAIRDRRHPAGQSLGDRPTLIVWRAELAAIPAIGFPQDPAALRDPRWRFYALAAIRGPADSRRPAVVSSMPRGSAGSAVACVAATENGGSYGRSSNPTHFGRYQFDRSTWAAWGGNPADWGTASPAEQDRVFANAVAGGGLYQGWLRWDGCR